MLATADRSKGAKMTVRSDPTKPPTVIDENGVEVYAETSDMTPSTPRPKQRARGVWEPDPGYRVRRRDESGGHDA